MKKTIILTTLMLISGCKFNLNSGSYDFKDIIKPRIYTLTFKFAVPYIEETEDINEKYKEKLKEVAETERYTYKYTFLENHLITVNEWTDIYNQLNKEIPNNNGGYYSFGDFYNDLEMSQDIKFESGFKVDNDYTFYYTIIGGQSLLSEYILDFK